MRPILALLLTLLITPSSALAAQRFASPEGADSGSCNPTPCSIRQAVNLAATGDEVIVNPGTYTSSASPGDPITQDITTNVRVNVHGVAGQPRPVLVLGNNTGLGLEGAGSQARYLEIRQSDNDGGALHIQAGSAEEVIARSDGGVTCQAQDSLTLRDTLCETRTELAALFITTSQFEQASALRNVTLVNSNGGGLNLDMSAGGIVNATNLIARGAAGDIGANGTSDGQVNLDHSSFATVSSSNSGSPGGPAITAPTANANQTAAPLFANAAAGDFHEAAGSPTIDAGANDPSNAFDADLNARQLGPATDIGAFETAGPAANTPEPPALAAVSGYGLSRSTFAAASKGPSAQAAAKRKKRKKAKVGTTVSYTLNTAATVTFTVQRRTTGRKVKKGKKTRCVARTRKNRKKKRCTRYVKVKGSFTQAGKAGKNRFKFSGRLRGRKLKPGRYKLVATPGTGATKGKARSKAFRIVR
jgi:hypothetical protein